MQLQRNLRTLEKIGNCNATELLLVGGGNRNAFRLISRLEQARKQVNYQYLRPQT